MQLINSWVSIHLRQWTILATYNTKPGIMKKPLILNTSFVFNIKWLKICMWHDNTIHSCIICRLSRNLTWLSFLSMQAFLRKHAVTLVPPQYSWWRRRWVPQLSRRRLWLPWHGLTPSASSACGSYNSLSGRSSFFEYVDHIFNIIRPRCLLYMAVNGRI